MDTLFGKQGMDAFREHLRTIGRKGGLVKSDKKAKAARKNGKRGGRPPDTYQELRGPASVSVTGRR